jgi:hypothetical protein
MEAQRGQEQGYGGGLVAGASVLLAAVALVGVGLFAGWLLFSGPTGGAAGTTAEETAPPATQLAVPGSDVRGADVAGLPRYPGSVRAEYERVEVGNLVSTEAEYVTTEDAEAVQEFYREVFESGGWAEADVGVMQGEVFYFVTRDEQEAVVEVEPRAGFVEVEIELSEPAEGR